MIKRKAILSVVREIPGFRRAIKYKNTTNDTIQCGVNVFVRKLTRFLRKKTKNIPVIILLPVWVLLNLRCW